MYSKKIVVNDIATDIKKIINRLYSNFRDSFRLYWSGFKLVLNERLTFQGLHKGKCAETF